MSARLALGVALALASASTAHAYRVHYEAQILPDQGVAQISIALEQQGEIEQLSFGIEPERFFEERADGELVVVEEGDEVRLVWRPPPGGGVLRYGLRIDRTRDPAEYDARCASTWMLARGEHLFRPMASRFRRGEEREAEASLSFRLPPRWEVVHPFPVADGRAIIEQAHRKLDQPRGWIVAGELERVEAEVAGSRILLAAPRGHRARLRDLLAFLRWTLPELERSLGRLPKRFLIASAGDPMWRGGLSGPASLYLHADRPFIDGDASSPVLHELVHTIMRARSAPGDDWIVEGIAEHYSRAVLRRTGAVGDEYFERTLEEIRAEGAQVDRLHGEATGAETALAVAFFHELDGRIRAATDGQRTLDDVVEAWVGDPTPISRADLVETVRARTGVDITGLLEARIPPSTAGAR